MTLIQKTKGDSMKITTTAALLLLALAVPATGFAAAKTAPAKADTKTEGKTDAAKTVTLKGEVVDAACYLMKGAKGAEHKECAVSCLKGGGTASFLAADGKLFMLIADHGQEKLLDDAKAKAGDQITISGTEVEKGGLHAIALTEVK
jgi:hypothetical protein